jgi:copper chaperone
MEFQVPAMSCGHCVKAITQILTELGPAAQVRIDLPTKKVTVQTAQDREKVAKALAEAGYPTA